MGALRSRGEEIGRRFLPPSARRGLRRAYYAMDRPRRIRARVGGERRPIPPELLRERIGASSIASYFITGERWADSLDSEFAAAGMPLSDARRLLDFGCGAGKVLQELTRRYPDAEWHGCDLHDLSVRWVAAKLPVRAVHSDYRPPLAYPDGFFDRIYLCSVFTHLGPDLQASWLGELTRVAAPGAGLAISINSETSGYVLEDEAAPDAAEIEEAGVIFRAYKGDGAAYEQFAGTTETYGLTFQSHEWTLRAWSENLVIERIVPRGLGNHQDLVLARTR